MAAPAPITPPRVAVATAVSRGNNRIANFLNSGTTPGTDSGLTQSLTDVHQVTQVLAPNAHLIVSIPGISFYFPAVSSLSGIQARPINPGQSRSFVNYVQGTGLRLGTVAFSGIELINVDTVNANTFTVIIAGGIPDQSYDEFIDKRVIVTQTHGVGGVIVNLITQQAPTFLVGFTTRAAGWADLIGAGATQDVTDGYLGKQRKSIIFANDDAAAVLTVFDTAGNILGSVQPATSWTTDAGGDVKLHNPTAGNVIAHIGEVYYS